MKKILVIEDSEQNLYLVRFILERRGFEVLAAADGPSGIASALQHRPALILLDIQLPGMDGHEVARRLRARPELESTPIVAVTSYAMAGDRERILEAGCNGYLEKPIQPETFGDDVEAFVRRGRSRTAAARVLVVDDVEANRELLRSVFAAHGWEVQVAADGVEALALARARPPGLLVSDILMPRMDGFTLCREWRRDPALQEVPFAFYTATYTDAQDERFGLSLGADAFLVKPMEPHLLMERLGRLVVIEPGVERPPRGPVADEESTLREYNAALIRKLEAKMVQVEALNRQLEGRVKERTRELEAAHRKVQAFGHLGTWESELEPGGRLTWSEETCRIFGIAPEQFDGQSETFFRLVHPEDRDAVRAASREMRSSRRRYSVEHRILRPDGAIRWVQQEGEPTRDGEGRLARVVGIVRDITDYRALEERLRQAEKMKAIGQLAGGVAHDFNNLLTVIHTQAEMATIQAGLPRAAAEALSEIVAAVERASGLTRQLLAFGRRQAMRTSRLDLNGVVTGMGRLLRTLLRDGVQLREELAPNLPAVSGDKSMLEQVVMNLVVNARDALPGGGVIVVRTADVRIAEGASPVEDEESAGAGLAPGRYVCLSVEDTGCGIDAVDLPRVFEPFYTTKPEGQGTGLGLAVVYGVVQQHLGQVAVDSRKGQGTTFRVFLPCVCS